MVFKGKKKENKTKNKKKAARKGFPRGLLASAATQLLGEIAKPLFKIIFDRGKTKRR